MELTEIEGGVVDDRVAAIPGALTGKGLYGGTVPTRVDFRGDMPTNATFHRFVAAGSLGWEQPAVPAPAPAAEPFVVDEVQLAIVASMGFSVDQAKMALQAAFGDANR